LAALQKVDENAGQIVQHLLQAPQAPPVQALVTSLINDFAAIPRAFVLVLDDYHEIHNTHAHDALAFLLNHQPSRLHLVTTTRQDPPLPLPRLRVRGQLTERWADDLRFTADEAAAFLDQALGLTLDAEIVAALKARTEGWIDGLQLAALVLQKPPSRAYETGQGIANFRDF
jgi:LuxR family maltose regulon positive regulatory protein